MSSILKTNIHLPMAAILLAAAFAGPAVAADKFVPFKGSLHATETIVTSPGTPPTSFVATGNGGGVATQLGLFTMTWEFTVILADGTGSGPVRYTAANGDQLFTSVTGASEPTSTPGLFHITEVQTITGGTGRFTNAKGTFIVERWTDLNSGLTYGSFSGTISSLGEAH